ncbi:SdpI/YhfL protein family protein [uncultured archaeon]|nr:SdpI/YhfL protein family protein [uncultured archaeon]
MEKEWIAAGILVVAVFAAGAYFYPQLPQNMAVHWGLEGSANGYMEKGIAAAFMLPALMLVLLALFFAIPFIDPLKQNYKDFKKEYNGLALLLTAFLGYVYALSLAYNLGYKLDMTQLLAPGLAALVFYVGILLGKAKRNWFVGIRTPWTLSDDDVWKRTHELGSKLFKAAGIAMLLGLVFPVIGLGVGIAVLIGSAIGLVVYSYVIYSRKARKQKTK